MEHIYFNATPNLPRKAAFIAIALAFAAPAWADEDEEITRLIKPESVISVGAGYVSANNQRAGMYNGLNKDGGVGLVDFSVVRRDDETGTWMRLFGRNVGLDNRELQAEIERQGHWRTFIEYNQITRHTPYTVQTNVRGIGDSTLTVPGNTPGAPATGSANSYSLKTERQRTSFGANYTLTGALELRVLFQNEEKQGQRLFGRGTTGGITPQEFLVEPINTNTRQLDMVLDYTGESLQLSGGYYGSFFTNSNPFLNVVGGNTFLSAPRNNAGVIQSNGVAMDNISLPPDNQAHQLHLAGGYQLAKTTRFNFKLAKTVGLQNADFMPVNFYGTSNNGLSANTSGRSNLGGRVDTTLVNLGITSRPISKLSLLGNVRYEERDDKTIAAQYITGNALNASTNGFNEPRSLTTRGGKLEASYQLPAGFRVTGGYDFEEKIRNAEGVRVVGYRDETREQTYRAEVKRAMAESLTGGLAYIYSERTGSAFNNLTTLGGYAYPTFGSNTAGCAPSFTSSPSLPRCGLIQPIYMADRERSKVRWISDWSPTDQLSAQLMLEASRDNYGSRNNVDIGTRSGDSYLLSLDVAYTLSDRWKLNGWFSRTEAGISQATIASPSSNSRLLWTSEQTNLVDSFGVGMRGKLPYSIDVGADYLFSNDRTKYNMANSGAFGSTTTVNSLPDIRYRQQTVRLFGAHAIDKSTTLRLDYIYDKRRIDDWTWSDWTYTDGTRIVQDALNSVHFLGVSVSYKFN